MENLLLQPAPLLVTKGADVCEALLHGVVLPRGEVLRLCVVEGRTQPLQLPLSLFGRAAKSVQGLPCFGLC